MTKRILYSNRPAGHEFTEMLPGTLTDSAIAGKVRIIKPNGKVLRVEPIDTKFHFGEDDPSEDGGYQHGTLTDKGVVYEPREDGSCLVFVVVMP